MNILEVNNIYKNYEDKIVLKDIKFSMQSGEIIGLVGPNGAGKTTLMKIITGLLEQDSGMIKICEISIQTNRENYLGKFSSIIETPSLYETLSGYDNINIIRKINNIPKEKMVNILKFIGIKEMIYSKVKNYSLGMKQRLALGIALITEPTLLILDEPTNGLDPEGVIEFRKLLIQLSNEGGISILISSHILSELDKICTRVLFLKNSELTAINPNNTGINFQNIVLEVENSENIYAILKKIEEIEDVTTINSNKISIKVNKKQTPKLISKLQENNIDYTNIEILNNSIEQIYTDVFLGGNNA